MCQCVLAFADIFVRVNSSKDVGSKLSVGRSTKIFYFNAYVRKYWHSTPYGCIIRDMYLNANIVSLTCFLQILVPLVKIVISFLGPVFDILSLV